MRTRISTERNRILKSLIIETDNHSAPYSWSIRSMTATEKPSNSTQSKDTGNIQPNSHVELLKRTIRMKRIESGYINPLYCLIVGVSIITELAFI